MMCEPDRAPLDDLLRTAGEHLGRCRKLGFEWSIQIADGTVWQRDRFICWVESADQPDDLRLLGHLLEALEAPIEVLEAQRRLATHSVKHGLGASLTTGRLQLRLYLHHRQPGTLADLITAYRWRPGGKVRTASYAFHYLPATPEGETPLDLVDPLFAPVVRELLRLPRLQQLSGFWLRRHRDRVDQVDLALPWQPPLAELTSPLRALAARLKVPDSWIDDYREHPVRHLAFRTAAAPRPIASAYFSGSAAAAWPDSVAALKETVLARGTAEHAAMEQVFFRRLPASLPEPDRQLDDFYSTESLATWRRVLGEEMHYHAGLFEAPAELADEPDEPDDTAMEAALARAVTELYPFLPEQGRVYDAGCGWGGAMRMLARDLRCRVLGLTVSRSQFRYCAARGLPVRHGDAEATLPPGAFDCLLLLESLSHIRDKPRLLRVLRVFGKRLVMRVNCQDGAPNSVNFGGTMHMIRSSQLREMIERAGWEIVHWRDRRPQAMPSIRVWHRRLQSIPPTGDTHLETLRAYCQRVLRLPGEWAASNPLIEVVAD